MPSKPIAKKGLAVEAIEGKLYAISSTTMEIFDLMTNHWIRGKPIKEARSDFGVGVVDGTLFVAGGRQTRGLTDVIEQMEAASVFHVYQKHTVEHFRRTELIDTPSIESPEIEVPSL